MKKNIVLSQGVVKVMTFEEVLKQFKDMINRTANEVLDRFQYNKPEREDLIQELNLQTWEAFRRYDEKHAFSTYLHYRLQLGINKNINGMFAQKRTHKGLVSLNKELGEDGESSLENLLGAEDYQITSLEFRDYMNFLENKLSDFEVRMLHCLMNKKEIKVADLAIEWGVSRVTANNRVRKFREKVGAIMKGNEFVLR